jgi:hypothetical protein
MGTENQTQIIAVMYVERYLDEETVNDNVKALRGRRAPV